MAGSRSRLLAATPLVLLCAAIPGGAARAGVTAQMQPGYSSATSTTRDETGAESRFDSTQWIQRYRLGIDQQIYPLLSLTAGGNLTWVEAESRTPGAPRANLDSRAWNTFARLKAGGPLLNGALDYSRRWDDTETRTGGLTLAPPGSVRESFGATVGWRPADLPSLNLRLGRTRAYDETRQVTDQTSDEAQLSAVYQPVTGVDLRYAFRYGTFTDHRTDVVRDELNNSAGATWTGRYLAGRGNAYVGYTVTARTTETRAPGGGLVTIQHLPVAGLSIVETFPATPARVTLSPNAALINGDTAASAGVNLGTSASTGPEIAFRDLGAQFQDVVTPVNAIHVYVDRALPTALAEALDWAAFQSDDNVDWTPVALAGAVGFNPVLFRFEVPIERTQARYLKVVTRPLPTTATTDPQFREIFVTELQFLEVTPAELARGRTSDLSGNLSGTTRILLMPDLGLSYDFSGFITHADARAPTWAVTNGLSMARRLDPVFAVAARVDRSDSDAGRGRESQNRWSASLSAEPLPTLGAVASYSGQFADTEGGSVISNSGTLSARADLYEGIAMNATGSVSWQRAGSGRTSRSVLTSASTSIIPNRYLSLGGSASYTEGTQSGGGQPERTDQRGFLEASASLSPFPALALSGTVTRQFGGSIRPATLASFSGAVSPFPGGDLQLRYSYQETYDGAADQRTRGHGPGARWNIRPGWYLDVAYAVQDAWAPATFQHSRALNANLLITLR